jgi:hypothetical protein
VEVSGLPWSPAWLWSPLASDEFVPVSEDSVSDDSVSDDSVLVSDDEELSVDWP